MEGEYKEMIKQHRNRKERIAGGPEATRKIPNSPKSLRGGDYIYYDGQKYLFRGYDPDDAQWLNVENIETKEETHLLYLDLVTPASEADVPVYARSLEELNKRLERLFEPPPGLPDVKYPNDSSTQSFEHFRTTARMWKAVVEAVDEAVARQERVARLGGEPFNSTQAVIAACRHLPQQGLKAGKSSYYKYKDFGEEHGWNIDRMASAMHRSTYGKTRMSRALLHLLDTLIMRHYRKYGCTGARIYYEIAPKLLARTGGRWVDPEKCNGKIAETLENRLLDVTIPFEEIVEHPEEGPLLTDPGKSVELPSKSWFYQYLRWFTHLPDQGRDVIVARYDVEKWEREHLVFQYFLKQAQFSRHIVFADHYLLDVWSLDGKKRLTRLWLTVLVCGRSKSIMGFALLAEPPSSESVLTALRSAIYPKNELLEKLGIEGNWDVYGIPRRLFLDNAWAHHSVTLRDFATLISCGGQFDDIFLDFRAPYKARYGSIIEEFFGNLAQLLRSLPGGIRGRDPKSLRSARESASLIYDDLLYIITTLIVRYQNKPNSSIEGLTPNEKWEEGMRSHGSNNPEESDEAEDSYRPLVPPLTPAIERLFLREYHSTREYRENGFSVFGLNYTMQNGESIPRKAKDGNYIDYILRYSTLDISRVSVFHEDVWMGDAFAKQLLRANGTADVRCSMAEREIAAQLRDADRSSASWYHYLDKVDERVKASQQARRRERAAQRSGGSATDNVSYPGASAGERDTRGNGSTNYGADEYTRLLEAWGTPAAR